MADFKIFTTPEGVLTVEALTPSEGALVWMRVRRGLGEVSISTANGCLYKGRAWPTVSLQDVRVWPDLAAFRADPDGTPLGDLFRALDASKASIAADLARVIADLRALEARCQGGDDIPLALARQHLQAFRARLGGGE